MRCTAACIFSPLVPDPHHAVPRLPLPVENACHIPGAQIGVEPGAQSATQADLAGVCLLQKSFPGYPRPDHPLNIGGPAWLRAAVNGAPIPKCPFTLSGPRWRVKVTVSGSREQKGRGQFPIRETHPSHKCGVHIEISPRRSAGFRSGYEKCRAGLPIPVGQRIQESVTRRGHKEIHRDTATTGADALPYTPPGSQVLPLPRAGLPTPMSA